jgi:endoglucanase
MKKSILLIGLLISYLSYSQGFLKTQGTEIVNDNGPVLLKSIGTGNWMIQEGYMMQSSSAKINTHTQFRKKLEIVIGEAHTKEFYNTWLANHFTKRDLDSMKSWGFNSLRVALHYKWFTVPIEEEIINSDGTFENTWLDKGFDMLDKLLSWCLITKCI